MSGRALRTAATGLVVVALLGAAVGAAAAPPDKGTAESVVVCIWGGTPDNASGTVRIRPGLTNTPAPEPLRLVAQGDMECSDGFSGEVTFAGVIEAGGTCALQVFDLKVKGLPGVARAYGPGVAGVVHEFLYDKQGNIVGADQPQVLSGATGSGSELTDCNTPDGFTDTEFSSTVELWR